MVDEGKTIKAVKKQAEKADKLWKETYQAKTPAAEPNQETVNTAPAQESPPPETPAETPSEPIQSAEPDYKSLYDQTTEKLKSVESLLDTEKKRYSTLQGKYDAEVPTLLHRVNLLTEEMAKIRGSSTQSDTAKPTETPKPEPTGAAKTLKEEFPDIYEGCRELIRDAVSEMVGREVINIKSRLDEMAEAKVKMDMKSFEDQIADLVPNWRDIDKDEAFISWLQALEPHGRTKHEMLVDAYNRKDAKGTAHYFKEYLRIKNPSSQTNENPPKPTNVTVPRGGSSQPTTTQGGDSYTRADLAKLYDDKVKGVYKGREDEYRRKEAKMIRQLTRG